MYTASDFKVTPKEAVQLQKQLREQVKLVPLEKAPVLIGGCDVSMNRFAKEGFAGFVTLTYPELVLIDHAVVKDTIPFPYVPGLLSFREIPMLAKAWERLKTKPDVLVVDGIGIAHPRRLGIATHLGLVLGIPTIGCAKSVLTGIYEEPGNEPGDISYLYDKYNKEEIIGAALRTKRNVKPVFVSPGHLITLQESIDLVYSCVRKHRLPEATRFAHNTVNEYRIADMQQVAL
ncbi:MAG: endonuclease [Parcubacteria group bacterium]|nr:endonuclease [Parcubacteria group bacterium]